VDMDTSSFVMVAVGVLLVVIITYRIIRRR
jgi:hypothetical protein